MKTEFEEKIDDIRETVMTCCQNNDLVKMQNVLNKKIEKAVEAMSKTRDCQKDKAEM